MEIRKLFKRTVVLAPVDLHTTLTTEEILLEKLRRNLIGRVEKSCFVLAIERIESYSSPYLLVDAGDGSVQRSVEFWVRAVVLEALTPLIGRIRIARQDRIQLTSVGEGEAHVSLTLREALEFDLMREGLCLPVLVLGAHYNQLSHEIAADATFRRFFNPHAARADDPLNVYIYRCTGALTETDAFVLRERLEKVRGLPPPGPVAREVMALMHPWKTFLPGEDLLAAVERALGEASGEYYCRPAFLNYLLPEVLVWKKVPSTRDRAYRLSVQDRTRAEVLHEFLCHYAAFHQFGQELERVYAEFLPHADYQPLWNYYRNRKAALPAFG